MDVLCIGTAVVDILAMPMPDQNDWKEKQRIERIVMRGGGDAANQSVHLAKEGLHVSLCASIGDDSNGDMLEEYLKSRGVDTARMVRKQNVSTGTALVLVNADGTRRTFSVKGAHSELCREDLPVHKELERCVPRAISIGSLFSLPLLEKEGLAEYLEQIRKKFAIPVFADLGSDKLKQGLDGIRQFLPNIDYFLPSSYDAMEMTGADTVEKAAEIYLSCGCRCVVIKCGAAGCYYAAGSEKGWIPALKVKPVDTTGAGDCMVALFVARILAGDTIAEACRYACEGASRYTTFFRDS